MNRLVWVYMIFTGLLLGSCRQGDAPKPRGYFRIDMPERDYQLLDKNYPYSFEFPVYTVFAPDTRQTAEAYWADVIYPDYRGRIHLSYKHIESREDLEAYLEDTRTFVHRHIPKATAITDEMIIHTENDAFGMIYHIKGREAASALQFFVTDSVKHFLRGALYFDVSPNNDSLAPVISHIEGDVRHLFKTINWH